MIQDAALQSEEERDNRAESGRLGHRDIDKNYAAADNVEAEVRMEPGQQHERRSRASWTKG